MSTFTPVHLSSAWQALQGLAQTHLPTLRELLSDTPRSASLHLKTCGIHMDFSHQRVNAQVMNALHVLAKDRQVDSQLLAMFHGEAINTT